MELNKWALIAKNLEELYGVVGKSGKQIRERWNNHLDPNIIKTPITLKEGIRIFEAHHRHGNKWAEITSLLPGRTDNTVKNYFYATVRRHLRKLNKCLRNSKFCETFNLESKQTSVNFLINALETGELDYYEIRKIENRELMQLVKMNNMPKKAARRLDGKGKNINKNMKLLKDMLSMIEIDLEKQDNDNDSDKGETVRTLKSTKKDETELSQEQPKLTPFEQQNSKRMKINEFEEAKEKLDLSDDVNFHEVPVYNKYAKNFDFDEQFPDDNSSRIDYEKIYALRRRQKAKGKRNTKLSDITKMLFSYPSPEEREEQKSETIGEIGINIENCQRAKSTVSFNNDKPNEINIPAFQPFGNKNIDSTTNKDVPFNIFNNKTPTGNYEIKNDTFTYEFNVNQSSTKNYNMFEQEPYPLFGMKSTTPTQNLISSTSNNVESSHQSKNQKFAFPNSSVKVSLHYISQSVRLLNCA